MSAHEYALILAAIVAVGVLIEAVLVFGRW